MKNDRQALIDGYRALADWLKENPDMPTPAQSGLVPVGDREEFLRLAKRMGFATKDANGKWYSVVRHFGPAVRYEIFINREKVCEKTVVGTREIQAHTEEIVEWTCSDSLLEPK